MMITTMGCSAQKQAKPLKSKRMTQPTLVYKTKQNYDTLVPVLLSDDKAEIVVYPAPTDVYYAGKLALPTPLKNGYLLDNRGIGVNVAFLKISYQAYSQLTQAPSLAELQALIIDKDPLLELYDCGSRKKFKKPVSELSRAIVRGKLKDYRRLK